MNDGNIIKTLSVLLFIALLIIGQIHSNFHSLLYKRVVASIGVFVLLFLCEYISNVVFGKNDEKQDKKPNQPFNLVQRLISTISYASMACYMFHRLFFWMGEQIWNPSVVWIKWLYMGCLIFPIMLVLSYYIQKYYNLLIKRL